MSKKLKVTVEFTLRREYEIPVSEEDWETIKFGECTYDNDPEIDVVHEAFQRLRKENNIDEYVFADDTDYTICDEDGTCIIDWD